uniref:Nterminal acetyltransferase A complex subunit nat1like protein putative n=1 Tax=Albugo laibachii Nc14 TaxID=890382 RepID=F0WEF2_9STRA|nr:Nterminal acetyltransferase A complex subunit nat1like protein putative [Albugo laibachii Nc14]|eukprot:CCA19584.1 Nterminal acetyltransferase A complex subunit nat1like protein putative [Albugo laibachii Nc14]
MNCFKHFTLLLTTRIKRFSPTISTVSYNDRALASVTIQGGLTLPIYCVKQYKKGLKTSDSILKKYPEHGETLSMKGLLLSCMNGRKEEAYDFARLGLKNDLKSHVCWHVYGLLYRSDRNYNEAIKCYRNAIRLDPQNVQILRDLYLLQVQMRDLRGFAETRRAILTLMPNNRNNWIGFAIAHHLLGNYQMAIDIINKYVGTLDTNTPTSYEDSEMYLYQNQLIQESGDIDQALQHLMEKKTVILDTLAWRQRKAEFLVQLERFDEAVGGYEELLDINCDNFIYHHGLQCALIQRRTYFHYDSPQLLSVCPEFKRDPNYSNHVRVLIEYYEQKRKYYIETGNKCASLTYLRLLLDLTTGDAFKILLDEYLHRQLLCGVPSVGSEMRRFYKNEEKDKIVILETLLVAYLQTLEQHQTLDIPPTYKTCVKTPSTQKTLLWTHYLAAQHFDRLQKYDKALKYIEKCIDSEPSVLDFHQRKGRIFKHQNEFKEAADVMIHARKLDLNDRYINNKATKYLLRADRVQEANSTIALFTRHEGDPQQNLNEMQCMWYELACGRSHVRQKHFGMALKQFYAIDKHFQDFEDDQFDFHTYCVRKMTLRAYVQVLSFCDSIYKHPIYVKAAVGIITTYLALYEERLASDTCNGFGSLSITEKKKAKRAQAKARKAEFKKKEEEMRAAQMKEMEKEKEKEKEKSKRSNTKAIPKDLDPLGHELLRKPALEEAWKFVVTLQKYAGDRLETHFAAFDVAVRKERFLLCLQALLKGKKCIRSSSQERDWWTRVEIFQCQLLELDVSQEHEEVIRVIQKYQSELKLDSIKEV